MDWSQIFLACALVVYLGAFVVILVAVRFSAGVNPRGHVGGHRLAAWLNGMATFFLLLTAIAYVLDARSVVRFGHIPLLDSLGLRGLGVVAILLSGLCLVRREASLGRSFRVALPDSKQPLVIHGVYRFTRNPLALSVDLLALGVLLLVPSWLALVSLVLNVVSYEWKVRIEESYLREMHGADYDAYCRRTGRYLPRLSRYKRIHHGDKS